MSNNEETGPSNQDADEMDYEGEQEYLNFLSEERVPVKGAAMLPPKPLEALSGDLRRLHDHVLSTEKSLLDSKDPAYPTYATRVPEGKCYVNTRPAEVFFLRFDHIFEMFLTRRLDFTIVLLFALHMSSLMKREQVSQICVADPY